MNELNYQHKYNQYLSENYGSKWSTQEDIIKSAVKINIDDEKYDACGLPLISDGKTVYVNNNDDHALIYGATGSKKTRTFVLPMINMMLRTNKNESIIVSDPKGEVYAHTADTAKALGYDVITLNFRDFSFGDGYNPLSLIYEKYHNGQIDEAMEMINDFVNLINASQRNATYVDPFWCQTASTFATSNLLFLMETAEPETANISSFTALCLEENYEELKKVSEKMDTSTIAGMGYKAIFGEPEKTRQSTQASLTAMVQPFIVNQQLQNMMSSTTFDITSIGKKKTIVYIIMSDEKDTYYFLVSMLIKQIYECLIKEAQKTITKSLPLRVNYVLDEFASLPRIDNFEQAMAAARSRNIRFFIVVQNLGQLEQKYGKTGAEIIKGNCNDWVFLTSKELSLLREISELCGNKISHNSVKPLISISELQRLKKSYKTTETLILNSRNNPFITELADISCYENFTVKKLAKNPPIKFGERIMLDVSEILEMINQNIIPCPFSANNDNFNPEFYKGEQFIGCIYSILEEMLTELSYMRLKKPIDADEAIADFNEIKDIQLISKMGKHFRMIIKRLIMRNNCRCRVYETKLAELNAFTNTNDETEDKLVKTANKLNFMLANLNLTYDDKDATDKLKINTEKIHMFYKNIQSSNTQTSEEILQEAEQFVKKLTTDEIYHIAKSDDTSNELRNLINYILDPVRSETDNNSEEIGEILEESLISTFDELFASLDDDFDDGCDEW